MATPSTTYNPDHQSIGPERGFEDYNMLEESCEYSRYTLAGINERAEVMEPYNAANREEYRAELAADAIDHLMSEIAKNQAIQKSNRSDSPAWAAASANLAPLFAEMAKFQAAGFDTNVKGGTK